MFAKAKLRSTTLAVLLIASTAGTTAQSAPLYAKGAEIRPTTLFTQVDSRPRDRHWNGWRDQGVRHGHRYRMGVKEMRRSLRARGFHRIRIIDVRPYVFRVRAFGHGGMAFRLVVDRMNGQILRMRPARGGKHWSYRW